MKDVISAIFARLYMHERDATQEAALDSGTTENYGWWFLYFFLLSMVVFILTIQYVYE